MRFQLLDEFGNVWKFNSIVDMFMDTPDYNVFNVVVAYDTKIPYDEFRFLNFQIGFPDEDVAQDDVFEVECAIMVDEELVLMSILY